MGTENMRTAWLRVYEERVGPTPIHLEPGRETTQRRGYWASAWETRSAHPSHLTHTLARLDSNQRPSGYEPDELPLLHAAADCP